MRNCEGKEKPSLRVPCAHRNSHKFLLEQNPQTSMKICSLRLSTLLLSLFVTFILSSGCHKPVAPKVTVAELVKAYDSDVQAADQAYKGKTLTVSGRVESLLPIGPPAFGPLKDLSGQPLIFMENQRVACTFAPGQYESAAPESGKDVVLTCRCDGKYGARIVLKDCVIN
jgi:hypothetical protein